MIIPDMKIITAILGFIVKLLAGSFIWVVVALVASIPLGLVLLNICDEFITDNRAFYEEINSEIILLYTLFALTCFVGIILARVVAVSIKTLADKKITQKSQQK